MLQLSTLKRQFMLGDYQSIDAIEVHPINVTRPIAVPILPLIGELLGHLVKRIPRLKKKPFKWQSSASDHVVIIEGGASQAMTGDSFIDSRHVPDGCISNLPVDSDLDDAGGGGPETEPESDSGRYSLLIHRDLFISIHGLFISILYLTMAYSLLIH